MVAFLQGFADICTPFGLVVMLFGTVVGIVFGAIPGLSSVMAIALFLPVTYGMSPTMGLALLIGLYVGATSGGLIAAILLKIPGTPASVATCWDGHPMREKGEGPKALGAGVVFSAMGTIFSILALVSIAPRLAKLAIKFGPHEYFALAMFSLVLIIMLAASGKMVKGVFAGILGFVFGTVGLAPIDAVPRFTFGRVELNNGFDTLPVLIGLFAISEIISTAETIHRQKKADIAKVDLKSIKGFGFSLKEFKEQIGNFISAALVGTGIGVLPGIGAGTSNIVAYTVNQRRSKHPDLYGTGILDGIVSSETANNASIGGAMIPLLTLGIPGDGNTALLLGAFMVHGIAPGPMLFTNYGSLVYAIFAALIVTTIMMFIVEFYGMRLFVRVLNVPMHLLLPIIFTLCVVGTFALNGRVFDVWSVLIFGLVGFIFTKFGVPQAPFIIGFILGPMAELNLRRGLMLSDGNFFGFFQSPIASVLLGCTVLFLIWSAIKEIRAIKVAFSAEKEEAAKAE